MAGNGTMVRYMWMVEVPLQVGKYHPGIITNAVSDSSAVYYALTMRSIMALGKSAGSSSFRMSTNDQSHWL